MVRKADLVDELAALRWRVDLLEQNREGVKEAHDAELAMTYPGPEDAIVIQRVFDPDRFTTAIVVDGIQMGFEITIGDSWRVAQIVCEKLELVLQYLGKDVRYAQDDSSRRIDPRPDSGDNQGIETEEFDASCKGFERGPIHTYAGSFRAVGEPNGYTRFSGNNGPG